MHPFPLVSREFSSESSVVDVAGVQIGGGTLTVIAGPCAIESYEQLLETAKGVKQAGAQVLRGGAFKPRTSPYSFQGLGQQGLEILAQVGRETGLKTVTEVMCAEDLELVAGYVDILQIGSRNMHNYSLLREVGRSGKPVILKRGLMATVNEWLMAAEYICLEGNKQVILCERGIRSYEPATRNTFDVNAIPLAKSLSHLPVIADPSHGTGLRVLVGPVAQAAVAAGADGLMVEVHPHPEQALSDGPQSLDLAEFSALMQSLNRIASSIGRQGFISCTTESVS